MDGREEGIGRATEELDRLFLAFLEAEEAGRDAENELVERAGPLAAGLAERIRVHRELTALSRDLGVRRKPARIGRFEVVRLVGSGGISRVYEAHDPRLGRTVALKVLDRKGMLDRSDRAWVLNEGRSLARITHRNVARVFDVGEIDEDPYIAMELLPGPSLADVIRLLREARDGGAAGASTGDDRARALAARYASWSARIGLLESLAGALAHCHDHGILHRDVKPANVIFDADGEPRLIDFGLAHVEGADEDSRLGLTQALVGTAAYIAPEQVTSDATGADPRSDQFSLGTLGYELLALENPFHRPSRHATLAAVEAADPPPLATRARAVPPDLARVIHHALARDPDGRYPDLAALAADLRAVREHRPISVAEPSLGHVARLWLRRHGRRVAAVGGVGIAAAAVLALTWTGQTIGLRRTLLSELERLRPESLSTLAELDRAGAALADLKLRARAHDSGWIRGWFPLQHRVDATIRAWSRRLSAMLAAEEERCAQTGLPLQDAAFQRLVWEDAQLCPDCPFNSEARARGSVLFPDVVLGTGEHVFQQLAVFQLPSNEPAPTGADRPPPDLVTAFVGTSLVPELVAGTYRLLHFDSASERVRRELVFHVDDGWYPQIVLDLRRPHADLLRETMDVPRGTVQIGSRPEVVEVARFRVMTRLVTRGEFVRFAQSTGRAVPRDSEPPDAPAWCDYASALAFAAWAGGRLPMAHELRRAQELGLVLLTGADEIAGGEFLLDLVPTGHPRWLPYGEATRPQLVPSRTTPVNAGTIGIPTGFRLAFSSDDAEEYRRLSASPPTAREKR